MASPQDAEERPGRTDETEVRAMTGTMITRRGHLTGLVAAALSLPGWSRAQDPAHVRVSKDPSCGCCKRWVEHLRQAGFDVSVTDTDRMNLVKKRLGVPDDLASCHTAEVDGFVLEGHVPAAEVKRLLVERPRGRGLAVPGMPEGSPGMETDGSSETFDVVLFGPAGRHVFARYDGARPLRP
jgi:hypothetical protein